MARDEDREGYFHKAQEFYGRARIAQHKNNAPAPVEPDELWTPEFKRRVSNAIYLSKSGVDPGEIRAKHGAIVWRAALRYMHEKC